MLCFNVNVKIIIFYTELFQCNQFVLLSTVCTFVDWLVFLHFTKASYFKVYGYTSTFFCHVCKGRQFVWLPGCYTGGRSLPKMRSTVLLMERICSDGSKLRWKQILSFMRWPQFIWETPMKMTELLPIKMYPFTLMHIIRKCHCHRT